MSTPASRASFSHEPRPEKSRPANRGAPLAHHPCLCDCASSEATGSPRRTSCGSTLAPHPRLLGAGVEGPTPGFHFSTFTFPL